MPKQVKAREAQDEQEERTVRKLAKSYHAPVDWKFHTQMVVASWVGKTPKEIAADLECHPQTVRIHLARFNAEGIAGLGMRPGSGRKPRLTERERSRILGLVKQLPPGRLERPTGCATSCPSAEVAGHSRSMRSLGSDKGSERALREPFLTPSPRECTSPSLMLA
jgi:hypothetical protein